MVWFRQTLTLPIPTIDDLEVSQMDSVFAVKCCADIRSCVLTDRDGFVLGTYPYVWLRDNCQCEQCFHPSLYTRLLLVTNLDLDIAPMETEIKESDQTLVVKWSGKHLSNYSISWLLKNHFPNTIEDPISNPKRNLWGSEMQQKISSFTFNDILKSDKFLYDWIEALQVHGLAMIKDAPQQAGTLLEIGRRVGFLKTTNYGWVTIHSIDINWIRHKHNIHVMDVNGGWDWGLWTKNHLGPFPYGTHVAIITVFTFLCIPSRMVINDDTV